MRSLYLKTLLLSLCMAFTCHSLFAQLQMLTPNDTIVCPGATATLRAQMNGRNKTVLSLPVDDQYSSTIPIGFSFNFYGNSYSRCIVSSNGFISFDSSNAGGYSNWDVDAPLLGNTNCLNSICGVFEDIYPIGGGNIDYATVGTAPNRKFVVTFCNCAMYSPSLGCNDLVSFQMILYETTNKIEVHIKQKTYCLFWPTPCYTCTPPTYSGTAIEGLQNADGTKAVAVLGRDYPSLWTAYDDGQQFTPNATMDDYTVSAIPFNPIPDSQATMYWYQGSTLLGSGPTVSVTPTTATTYTVMATDCGDTSYASVEVLVGGGPNISSVDTVNPTTCGACNGKIVLHGLPPGGIDTIFYTRNGVQQTPAIISIGSDSVATLTNLCDGVFDNIVAKSGACGSLPVGPFTLASPAMTADFTFNLNDGCHSDTVSFNNTSVVVGAPMYSKWDFGDGSPIDTTTSPTHVYTSQGTYTVRLIVTNQHCIDSSVQTVAIDHPLHAAFTVSADTVCQHGSITFKDSSIATDPTYSWSFGDGGTSNMASPVHTFDISGNYPTVLIVQDSIHCFDTARINIQVDSISSISFDVSDTNICQGQSVSFTGHYIPIGYVSNLWQFNDNTADIADVNPVQHAFSQPGTYAVTLKVNYRVCPDTFATRQVTITPYPTVNLGTDTSMCPGAAPIPIADLVNAGNPNAKYLWNTGDTTASIMAQQPGTYYATVTINGCSNTDSIWVKNDCYMSIPNAFTPNDDGVNDYFFPRQFLTSSLTSFKMVIYDRWGEEIYETTALDGRGWDGKFNGVAQPEGVYVYIIDGTFANGATEHHQGNVTLLR